MTQTLTLTSKRQATFPAKLCKELGVEPGGKIILERRNISGEPEWVLRTGQHLDNEWFGVLRRYAKNKPHDMDSIRNRIGQKRAEESA
jgi:bifunctional DNA-binding transcriptional regulator/antitoxin component of YhaV-PrlF toxin-antitoxin module